MYFFDFFKKTNLIQHNSNITTPNNAYYDKIAPNQLNNKTLQINKKHIFQQRLKNT